MRGRWAAFTAMLLVCAAPLVWAAWFEHGVFWPDEIFQTLEQGHRFAFGYGLIPWEFRDGVRSWLVPGAMGLVMKAGALAGIHSGLGLARLVKLCVAAGTVLGCYATMRMAERLSRRVPGDRDGLEAAVAAGALYASCPFLVYFGSRCFTDTVSIPFVALGTLYLVSVAHDEDEGRRPATFAGMLFGLAALVRYQNVFFLAAALGVLATRRSWKLMAALAVGAAIPLVAGAILDWVTWGAPFAPLVRYARRVSSESVPGEIAGPVTYYATAAWLGLGWPSLVLLVGVGAIGRRAPEPLSLAAVFLIAHCCLANKQVRFVLPALPLVIGMAGAGLVALIARATRARPRLRLPCLLGVVSVVSVASVDKLVNATFPSMGREGVAADAWHNGEDATLALSLAGGAGDVCGVMFQVPDWGYTGVYTYLHLNVPLFHGIDPAKVPNANYIVAPRGLRVPDAYDQVMVHDTYAVYRRDGACQPPASYSWNSER